jgi:hypothetical protein
VSLDLRSGGEEPEAPSISVALLLRLERKDALGFGIEGALGSSGFGSFSGIGGFLLAAPAAAFRDARPLILA